MTQRGFGFSVLLIAVCADSSVHADALNDYVGPREIAVGESMRGDARGVLSTTLNPSGLALSRELVFEGSFGYSVDQQATALTASGCDSTSPVPGCYYYRYFSSTPGGDDGASRRVHEGGIALARALARQVTLGVNLKYFDFDSDVVGDEDASGVTFDIGATVIPAERIGIGLVGYNLYGEDSAQYPRGLAVGVAVRPVSALAVSLDGLWNLDLPDGQSSGRYGGGLEYFVATQRGQVGYPVRLGALYDVASETTSLTAGLGLLSAKLGVDVGIRKQLGDSGEFTIQTSIRVFGPRRIPGPGAYYR